MFPPQKAEEGLSQHFLQNDEVRQESGKQRGQPQNYDDDG
jgi:hypothetical protein